MHIHHREDYNIERVIYTRGKSIILEKTFEQQLFLKTDVLHRCGDYIVVAIHQSY